MSVYAASQVGTRGGSGLILQLLKFPLPSRVSKRHSFIQGTWPTGTDWWYVVPICVLLLHIRCWRDRHGRSSPIVSCSNAALPSRGYNVPLDRSRGFCRSRHSIHRHTCPFSQWIVGYQCSQGFGAWGCWSISQDPQLSVLLDLSFCTIFVWASTHWCRWAAVLRSNTLVILWFWGLVGKDNL